jgi:hypothetical protein
MGERLTVAKQLKHYASLGPPPVRTSLRIAGNTLQITAIDGSVRILFWHTIISKLAADGKELTLWTAGHRTVTTKDRINNHAFVDAFVGWNLWQEKNIWWLTHRDAEDGARIRFTEGIRLQPNGNYVATDAIQEVGYHTELEMLLDKYIAHIGELPELPQPDGGDCWFCLLKNTKTGKPMGDMVECKSDEGHIVQHMRELYVPGALIVTALEQAGRPAHVAYGTAWPSSTWRDVVLRAIRKYVRTQCGLPNR